ncbi:phosphoglycolate phosphatase [Paraburkholderia heleia]|uniref:phosphoglycolate phosphatase n=1 Tax=Paraburkholderia heleia TaxID=634127 RepID=UPI002AB71131|nr:phosphoglycolate phosphatase [Paraburkholderia heleia]
MMMRPPSLPDGEPVRAVLLDLDGTMVDTAPDIAEAVGRMLAAFDTPRLPLATIRDLIGGGVAPLVRRAVALAGLRTDIDATRALKLFEHHYAATNGRYGKVYPHVLAGLDALRRRGCRLACVTNKPAALAAPLLEMTGLAGYLDGLVAGDTLPSMKPAPEPLWHACRGLRATSRQTVLVGDSAVDVAAARAAGVPVFIVDYGYAGPGGAGALQGDALIGSLAEVPRLLAARVAT